MSNVQRATSQQQRRHLQLVVTLPRTAAHREQLPHCAASNGNAMHLAMPQKLNIYRSTHGRQTMRDGQMRGAPPVPRRPLMGAEDGRDAEATTSAAPPPPPRGLWGGGGKASQPPGQEG
eukprot:SAG31_NODE_5396_length_2564_cov_1.180122_4_plen_118_part_01